MKLSELIAAIGDKEIRVEPVKHNLVGEQKTVKGGLRITLLTKSVSLFDLISDKPSKIGLLIWMPADKFNAVVATASAAETEATTVSKKE